MYSSQVCYAARLKIKLIKFVEWKASFLLVCSEIYFLINLELREIPGYSRKQLLTLLEKVYFPAGQN